jgi:hypothetical protein
LIVKFGSPESAKSDRSETAGIFEARGVEPVFLDEQQAIDYAPGRACFRSGEIRILDSNGGIGQTIKFNEADKTM